MGYSETPWQAAAFPPATVEHECAQHAAAFIALQPRSRPNPYRKPYTPADTQKVWDVYISLAARLASAGEVQRERDLPQERKYKGLRTLSRLFLQALGTISVGLILPVGLRFSRALVVEGDG